MNVTMELKEQILSKYFVLNQEGHNYLVCDKTTVYILVVLIGIIIVLGILMFRKKRLN